MVNLKIGAVMLVAGAASFLLSDTLFGDSAAASYAAIIGLILFPLGFILTVVGIFQALFAMLKKRRRQG